MDTREGPLVLVVDDAADIREAVTMFLELKGHRVVAARDGREALGAIREGLKPDVIVLDLMMPGMDGWGLVAALNEEGEDIPIIVVSAVAPHASPKGVVAVLRKPLDPVELERAVRKHASARPTA
jgi:CheY-like chemotaxis protein